MHASPFELLELPDGRFYVAKVAASIVDTLVAGSFARLAPEPPAAATRHDPVGMYATRDEAERAIQRAAPSPAEPLAPFAAWLRPA